MTHLDNPATKSQHERWLAARERMGIPTSAPPVKLNQRAKDIVQEPIQKRPPVHFEAANRKLAEMRERARREKAEGIRLKLEADARAFADASRAANCEVHAIVFATALHFGVPSQEILCNRRLAVMTIPRQVAMYLAKELTPQSYPAIGLRFHRDHTTVLHGVRRIQSMLAKGNPVVTLAVAAIKDKINGGDPQNYWGA